MIKELKKEKVKNIKNHDWLKQCFLLMDRSNGDSKGDKLSRKEMYRK